MSAGIVKVPGSLLLDRGLSPEVKLLSLALAAEPEGHRPTAVGLARALGISHPTVSKGLRMLASGSWGQELGWVLFPSELIMASHLSPFTRLMYGILQLAPKLGPNTGHFRYAELSALAGVCVNTAKRAVRELYAHQWLHLYQEEKFDPIRFRLMNPPEERRQAEVVDAELRYTEALYKGETLMREFLSLMVDSDEYEDDASPGFLTNPSTGEQLQLDRYYPPRVAFEYNGPQHEHPTEKFPSASEVAKQQTRDLVKAGICSLRGIHLRIVRAEDLSVEGMRRRIGDLLPLRNLAGHEPLIEYLESVGRNYQEDAKKWGQTERAWKG